jgi:hypothetical protein
MHVEALSKSTPAGENKKSAGERETSPPDLLLVSFPCLTEKRGKGKVEKRRGHGPRNSNRQ